MPRHQSLENDSKEPLRVGRIVGAFGLKGQVKIDPSTDFLHRFDKGCKLRLKGNWVLIESSSMHKGRPIVKFEGINDMTAAEKLQWEYLEAVGEPEMDDDEFLADDLVGLKVVTVEGELLGEVEEVLDYPAHEVLQIGEILIPLIKEFVKDIDFDTETIQVKLLYGMKPGEE